MGNRLYLEIVDMGMGLIAGAIFSVGILDFVARIHNAVEKEEEGIFSHTEDSNLKEPTEGMRQFWKSARAAQRRKKK